jgi:proteasome lid subunit RPN8/RPN11
MRTIINFGSALPAVWAHLLSNDVGEEEAAFLFAHVEHTSRGVTFNVRDWYAVTSDDYSRRDREGIELNDASRARLFKAAHEGGFSLVECHSHPGPWPAGFSETDVNGFGEFVPHVWWRLKGRPYAAIVVASDTFDAIAWVDSPDCAIPVDAITDGGRLLYPTHESLKRWEVLHGSV